MILNNFMLRRSNVKQFSLSFCIFKENTKCTYNLVRKGDIILHVLTFVSNMFLPLCITMNKLFDRKWQIFYYNEPVFSVFRIKKQI